MVLLLAGDLIFARDILGGDAHVIAVEGVPQPVADHGVDEIEVAHLLAGAQIGGMGGLAHRFLAARHHDAAVALGDGLGAERHGPKARAAHHVDAPGRGFDRQPGMDGSLAGRILALGGGEDLAEDHLAHVRPLDLGACERAPDRGHSQDMGGHAPKAPEKGADRGARRRNNHNIVQGRPPKYDCWNMRIKGRECERLCLIWAPNAANASIRQA